jgi:tRNA dimethylallyltransferase
MKLFISNNDFKSINQVVKESPSQLIVIAGQTASGKSSIALKLAKLYNGVIINADSRQIYSEVKIGVATPTFDGTKKESKCNLIDGIPHYLYSFISIFQEYSVADYKNDVDKLLSELKPKYNKIFLVGGTGLYIDSVVYNFDISNSQEIDVELRNKLNGLSVTELQNLLTKDQLSKLNYSDQLNPYRLIRHIEREGKHNSKQDTLDHLYIVLETQPEKLEENISIRTRNMFKDGLLDENTMIREKEKIENKMSVIHKTIGYQEFDSYFDNTKTLQEVETEVKLHTKQYAKRQKTWFKRKAL